MLLESFLVSEDAERGKGYAKEIADYCQIFRSNWKSMRLVEC